MTNTLVVHDDPETVRCLRALEPGQFGRLAYSNKNTIVMRMCDIYRAEYCGVDLSDGSLLGGGVPVVPLGEGAKVTIVVGK